MENDDEREAIFLIDRKNDYYHIDNPHFHFPLPDAPPDSFHTETLLDGELVLDTDPKTGEQTRRYLVFDCLVIDGQPMLNRTLDKRIGYFREKVLKPQEKLFEMFPEEKEEQPFEVVVKKMEKAYGIEMMFRDVLPKLQHGNDGLVFTCRTSQYVVGTDQHTLKWKPPHENTIDFRLQLGLFPSLPEDEWEVDGQPEPDYDACPEFALLVNKSRGVNEHWASLHVEPDEWESMKAMSQMLDDRIIECYQDDHKRWRFKKEKDGTPRFRDDKTEANHISTVDSVMESINDAVGEKDLLENARGINVAWKTRERELNERMRQDRARQPSGRPA